MIFDCLVLSLVLFMMMILYVEYIVGKFVKLEQKINVMFVIDCLVVF